MNGKTDMLVRHPEGRNLIHSECGFRLNDDSLSLRA